MFKKVELPVIIILFIFVFYCALTIGIPWDEGFEMTRGKERLKYLFSLGSYKSYWDYQSEEFNPGFYSTLAIFITNMFPKKFETEIFHLTNSIFSILTIFGIYKISCILFNKTVGKIIFLLCFVNPIFFGHMAMNSKDTIVAFANVWSTYILLRYLQNQNKNYKRYIILAGLTIGLGTGVRIPFVITLIPLFLFLTFDIFFLNRFAKSEFNFKKFIIHLVFVLLIAYIITISCWPHVHENIFTQPFKIAANLGNVDTHIFGLPWMLFNGNFYSTSEPPILYIITNFFYKSPEFMLLCYAIFIFIMIFNRKFFLDEFKFFESKILLILFIFLFPTLYLIFLPYKVYDGLRLFLYLIPYFSIIPGLAIYYLIKKFYLPISKLISSFVIILFLYYMFIFISLTPYQYTYLNKFIGNFSEAHKKFENDYWALSIEDLIKKISNETDLFQNNTKPKIIFCGAPDSLHKKRLKKLNYVKKNIYSKDFDYIIMTNRALEDKENNTLNNVKTCFEKFPGKNILSIERNGLVLSTLRKKI